MGFEPEAVNVKSEIMSPPALPTSSPSELLSNISVDDLIPPPDPGTTVTVEMPSETPVACDVFRTPVCAQQKPALLPKPIVPVIRGSQPLIQMTSSSVVSLVPVKMPQLPSQPPAVRPVTPVSTSPSIAMSSGSVASSPVMPIPSVQMIDTIRLPSDQTTKGTSLAKPMTSLVKGAPAKPMTSLIKGAPVGTPSAGKPYITESLDQPQAKDLKNINHQMPGVGEISEMELHKFSGKYRRTHGGLKTSWPLHVLDFSKKELGIYNNARYHMLPICHKDSDSYVKNSYPCSTLPNGRAFVSSSNIQMHSIAAIRVRLGIILSKHGSTSVDS